MSSGPFENPNLSQTVLLSTSPRNSEHHRDLKTNRKRIQNPPEIPGKDSGTRVVFCLNVCFVFDAISQNPAKVHEKWVAACASVRPGAAEIVSAEIAGAVQAFRSVKLTQSLGSSWIFVHASSGSILHISRASQLPYSAEIIFSLQRLSPVQKLSFQYRNYLHST